MGAGPAGYMAAELAGKSGLKTIIFDKQYLGGVCLNEGCIPVKTLLHAAKLYESVKYGAKYGIYADNVRFDYPAILKRKDKIVKRLVVGVASTLKKSGVEVIYQKAFIKGRTREGFTVESDGREYHCKNLLIATGSEPSIPQIPGLESVKYYTNREILQIPEIPDELTVLGAGYVGIEFASFFSAMGTRVTVAELMPEILPGTDKDIAGFVKEELISRNADFRLNSKAVRIEKSNLVIETTNDVNSKGLSGEVNPPEASARKENIPFKNLLISIGRTPVTRDLGLENTGVEFDTKGIRTDQYCRTNIPGVYAAGDVNGVSMLAHTAYREAQSVINNISGRKNKVRYNAIPSVVYASPEIASVGLTEENAMKQNIEFDIRKMPMAYSGRFVAENEGKNGLAKILVGRKYGEILGVHLAGNPASELIWGAAMMIENELRLIDVEEIVFPHPTVSEIIRETVFAFREL
jgi:dihydrolipoamide dehydrogenase